MSKCKPESTHYGCDCVLDRMGKLEAVAKAAERVQAELKGVIHRDDLKDALAALREGEG